MNKQLMYNNDGITIVKPKNWKKREEHTTINKTVK